MSSAQMSEEDGARPKSRTADGRSVEYVEAGRGDPLIVLESGLGDDWTSWSAIMTEIAKRSRVLAYSRPGYGGSASSPTPRDLVTQARELRAMLIEFGETPPFILVGHSLGGLIVQAFAAEHPEDVAGLVLIDAPHPNQIFILNQDQSEAGALYRAWAEALTGAPRAEHEALTTLGGGHLPGSTVYFGPTLILSAWLSGEDRPEHYRRLRRKLAVEQASRYTQGELRKVSCGHYIHQERPLAVIDAIEEILARARNPRFQDPSAPLNHEDQL